MQEFEDVGLLVTLPELTFSVAAVVTFEGVGIQAGLADEVPQFRGSAMDELGS